MTERRTLSLRGPAERQDTAPPRQSWNVSETRRARLKEMARAMRREPTEAEKALWERLGGQKLGGFKFHRQVVVGSTKSMTGHTLGAAGGVEAVICALVCREGVIPPTINYEVPDPECDLNYGTGGRTERPVRLALSNSFGFGGHNVCLAVRRWDE